MVLKAGSWAPPTLSNFFRQVVDLYLPPAAPVLAGFALVVIVLGAFCARRQPQNDPLGYIPPIHVTVAWVALLLVPIAALLAGKLATGTRRRATHATVT